MCIALDGFSRRMPLHPCPVIDTRNWAFTRRNLFDYILRISHTIPSPAQMLNQKSVYIRTGLLCTNPPRQIAIKSILVKCLLEIQTSLSIDISAKRKPVQALVSLRIILSTLLLYRGFTVKWSYILLWTWRFVSEY